MNINIYIQQIFSFIKDFPLLKKFFGFCKALLERNSNLSSLRFGMLYVMLAGGTSIAYLSYKTGKNVITLNNGQLLGIAGVITSIGVVITTVIYGKNKAKQLENTETPINQTTDNSQINQPIINN